MRDFNNLIEDLELLDFPKLGTRYTWSNTQQGEKWSRIDRFIVHPEWLSIFKLKLWEFPRLISDHCPFLLKEDDKDWGPKPSGPNCLKVMKKAWRKIMSKVVLPLEYPES